MSWLLLLADSGGLARPWIAELAWVLPSPAVTRWLLLADALVLAAIGWRARGPLLGPAVALAGGFLALNALGMLANDFYVGLGLFHLLVTTTGLLAARPRWLGAGALAIVSAAAVAT